MASPEFKVQITEGPALPDNMKRGGHIGGIVNGSILVAGGTNWSANKTTKYWLKTSVILRNGTWTAGPDLPKAIAYSMYAFDHNGLYVAGGTEDGKSVSHEVYKLSSLKKNQGWKSLPELPVAIGYGAGAILHDKFYITCGSIDSVKTNRVWVLDINKTESHWRECASLPGIARMFPSFASCGNYLYLLGGLAETSPLTPLQDVYRYDPGNDQWLRLADLPLAGYAWVSEPIDDGHLLITGRAYGNIDRSIWVIDLKDMSMEHIGNNIIQATTAPLIKTGKNQWWLIGGEPDSNKNRTGKVSIIRIH